MRNDGYCIISVTVGELRVSPWLAAPEMEHKQLGRRGFSKPTNGRARLRQLPVCECTV